MPASIAVWTTARWVDAGVLSPKVCHSPSDSTGSRSYNLQLSQRRADSVKAYLVSRGVPAERLQTVGAGPDHPVADNGTEAGRAQNRRVEITIVPVTEQALQEAGG